MEEIDFDLFEPVYAYVRTIPEGSVVTYGQIAEEVSGVSLTPRQVGTAMRYAPSGLPWQRVVGANGYLTIAKRSPELKTHQQELLEREGVAFIAGTLPRVDMKKHQWRVQEDAQTSLFEELL